MQAQTAILTIKNYPSELDLCARCLIRTAHPALRDDGGNLICEQCAQFLDVLKKELA